MKAIPVEEFNKTVLISGIGGLTKCSYKTANTEDIVYVFRGRKAGKIDGRVAWVNSNDKTPQEGGT